MTCFFETLSQIRLFRQKFRQQLVMSTSMPGIAIVSGFRLLKLGMLLFWFIHSTCANLDFCKVKKKKKEKVWLCSLLKVVSFQATAFSWRYILTSVNTVQKPQIFFCYNSVTVFRNCMGAKSQKDKNWKTIFNSNSGGSTLHHSYCWARFRTIYT